MIIHFTSFIICGLGLFEFVILNVVPNCLQGNIDLVLHRYVSLFHIRAVPGPISQLGQWDKTLVTMSI